MKKVFKILIMLILVLSFFSFNSSNTEAATTKIAHVNIKSGTLTVRSGAGTKYKKVGSLKKDAGVYIYSQTKNGWSEIRYKNKKAYVATKYLKLANSYLMNKAKVYRYMAEGGVIREYVYSGKNKDGADEWVVNGEDIEVMRENKNGLYAGYSGLYGIEYYLELKYPIKKGKSWINGASGEGAAITSVSKTVKTPAGVFKNCIEVQTYNGYKMYYAKNVGFIQAGFDGLIKYQLIRLENKK
ncbi:SH3 domain-containing protein [Peribacillus sp. Hz7]|uniref:SH3 domain-containing protein n=1 Tax=Peribacillus sp. Hz7 TaxID=3344873 RepID=UPI0035C960C2